MSHLRVYSKLNFDNTANSLVDLFIISNVMTIFKFKELIF